MAEVLALATTNTVDTNSPTPAPELTTWRQTPWLAPAASPNPTSSTSSQRTIWIALAASVLASCLALVRNRRRPDDAAQPPLSEDPAHPHCRDHLYDASPSRERLQVYSPPKPAVLIQLMGSVRVHGADLTADDVELLAVIACLGDKIDVHLGLIHEAIAPTRSRKTIENRISRLRTKLHSAHPDVELLPQAQPGRGGLSHYRLHPDVVTDLDLLRHRLTVSERVPNDEAFAVLSEGLELMVGPLFRARRGFDRWPQEEGVVAAATDLVQRYAVSLVSLARQAGRHDTALRTFEAASRVLHDPIDQLPFRYQREHACEVDGTTDLITGLVGIYGDTDAFRNSAKH